MSLSWRLSAIRKAGEYTCSSFVHRRALTCLRPSFRLKDAELPSSECANLYVELVLVMRKMFHQCKLVHADLSEYNILYHEGHLYIIDVSQSVEHDHPAAFDFLRKDIRNVEEFFGRLGVACLGLRRCFHFITQAQISSEPEDGVHKDDEAILRDWMEKSEEDDPPPGNGVAQDDHVNGESLSAHEDSVFLQSFIPRTLNEVYDPERDVEKLARGEGNGLIYAKTIGVMSAAGTRDVSVDVAPTLSDGAKPVTQVTFDHSGSESGDAGEDGESDESDDVGKDEFIPRKPRGHRHEDKEAKKVKMHCFLKTTWLKS